MMLEPETLIVLALYVGLGGAYLLVLPLALYYYLQKRWYVMGSIERLIAYFWVFLFFPGLLVLSPFLNLRPLQREIDA
jgi:NAD(P)H-quinone oxidoreductase subunit L